MNKFNLMNYFREEFNKTDVSDSSSLLNQLVYTTDNRKVCYLIFCLFKLDLFFRKKSKKTQLDH